MARGVISGNAGRSKRAVAYNMGQAFRNGRSPMMLKSAAVASMGRLGVDPGVRAAQRKAYALTGSGRRR